MQQLYEFINDNFNNRELAFALWIIIIFIIFSLKFKNIRSAVFGIVKNIFKVSMLKIFLAFALWLICIVYFLNKTNLWEKDQFTATILWYFLSGSVLLLRPVDIKEVSHFRYYITDTLKVTIIFEFIAVVDTFNFFIEFILIIPLFTLCSLMLAFAENENKNKNKNKKEYEDTIKFLNALLSIIGAIIFFKATLFISKNPQSFYNYQTIRNFILPMLLTAGSIPFYYLLHCYATYESSFIMVDIKTYIPETIKKYARKRFLQVFFLKPKLMPRATRQLQFMNVKRQHDVELIIQDIIRYEKEIKKTPKTPHKEGWSPYLACCFLENEGLKTDDYHAYFNYQQYKATSQGIKLKDEISTHAIFSIEGSQKIVNSLKLEASFNKKFSPYKTIDEFLRLSQSLCEISHTSFNIPEEVLSNIDTEDEFELFYKQKSISFRKYETILGFILVFEIKKEALRGK